MLSRHILSCRRFSVTLSKPSTKTFLRLSQLPLSATQKSIESALKKLDYRRLDIEPGCVIHVSNEAEADMLLNKLSSLPNIEVAI